MSAQYGAPGLGRAQVGTLAYSTAQQGSSISTAGRPARITRRAIAVAVATLCAPVVTAGALAAIAAVGGGNHAEMGSLAGAQGLRGTTIGATSPAPPPATGPADQVSKGGSRQSREDSVSSGKSSAQSGTHQPEQNPTSGQGTRAPTHKPTQQPAPKPPSSGVGLNPSTPYPNYDPSGPGAPTTSGTSGSTTSGTSGTDSSSGETTSTPDSRSGGD
jgi:hypothetical protein